MPIYENLVIGTFLYALGLKVGARQHDYLAPDFAVSLVQQTPLDIVLGDVLLTSQKSVALLEFKREASREGRWKERSKLLKIEASLKDPEFHELRDTSRQIHFYVETKDILDPGFSRVLPYLDLGTDDRGRTLEELIEDLVSHASSAPVCIEACQLYLNLVCSSQGYSYHASPGLLVGVGAGGRIAFASVDDIRDLRNTLAAIQAHQITLAREMRDLRLRESISQIQSLRQSQTHRLGQSF
jgi:hypothetical protein